MLKKYSYKTHGTCSRQIDVTLDGDVVSEVVFHNGCRGNTQGVAALVKGMKAEEAIARLSGIDCGGRGTSCPDQLARALTDMLNGKAN
ncbi:MAG: TIGR03905 family TSCPD domain-containing protein [Clostridia bacterium]|nr:TIGR03905 family TSCPD domain-containing protein [Clostridia bacterium]